MARRTHDKEKCSGEKLWEVTITVVNIKRQRKTEEPGENLQVTRQSTIEACDYHLNKFETLCNENYVQITEIPV